MAASRICSIPDCDKRHFGHGWCVAHYTRWRTYGDPLAGRDYAVAQTFFKTTVLPYDGDDCLVWPFARSSSGYAVLNHQGRMQIVSRLVCEHVNGPPPTTELEAAHSCGKGHEGCVAKRHLRWATPEENHADKKLHGTNTPSAKLTEDDVLKIRAIGRSIPQQRIAAQYGVSQAQISKIQSYKAWDSA